MLLDERLLPFDEPLERNVLGSVLTEPSTYFIVEKYITPDTFYNASHKRIYKAIVKLINNHEFNGIEGVHRELLKDNENGKDDAMIMFDIYTKTGTSAYAERNAMLIKQLELKRNYFTLFYEGANMALNNAVDVADIIDMVTEYQSSVLSFTKSITVTAEQAGLNYWDNLMKRQENLMQPISTGLQGLDHYLDGGFRKSNLIVLGGRPSMGKTALALFFTMQAAQQGKRTLYINIEMTTDALVERVSSQGVDWRNLRSGQLSTDEQETMRQNIGRFMGLPLTITENVNSFSAILAEARKQKLKDNLDFLVVDYLQLIGNSHQFERRQLEVAYMTRTLKALSKELDIPILLLAQLNRATKGQEKELPRLESLRESGDIEQDADIVMFCHRPDQVEFDTTAFDSEANKTWYRRGIIFIAKNREGERNVKVKFAHDPSFKQFCDDGLDPQEWGCGTEKPQTMKITNEQKPTPPAHDDITAF